MRIWKYVCPTLAFAALAFVVSPAHADRHGELSEAAAAAIKNGDYAESIALCAQVVSAPEAPYSAAMDCRDTQGLAQYKLGQYDEAIGNLTAVIAAEPRNPHYINTYNSLAWALSLKRFYDDAVHYINLKSNVYPLSKRDLVARASAHQMLGLDDEALIDLKGYAGMGPADERNDAFWNHLANAQLMAGDVAAARKSFRRSGAAGNPATSFTLARIEFVAGNTDTARAPYEGRVMLGVEFKLDNMAVIAAIPGSPAAQAGLMAGDILVSLGGQKITGGDQFLKLAAGTTAGQSIPIIIERNSKRRTHTIVPRGLEFSEEMLLNHLGYERFKQKKAAHTGAEKLLAAGDRRSALRVYAGIIAEKLPDADMITDIAELVKSLNPPPGPPAEAQAFARQGEILARAAVDDEGFTKAVAPYRDAVKLAPWWPDAHLNLALLYEKRGDYVLARHSFGNFLTLAGDAPEAPVVETKMFEMEYLAEAD